MVSVTPHLQLSHECHHHTSPSVSSGRSRPSRVLFHILFHITDVPVLISTSFILKGCAARVHAHRWAESRVMIGEQDGVVDVSHQ